MYSLFQLWDQLRGFLEMGGQVLLFIAGLTFFMWALILERLWYFRTEHKHQVAYVLNAWEARPERSSWNARQIRRAMISQVVTRMNATMPLIKTCVAVCPLLGLLGTVTGMIEVFDVMALTGSGNVRSMASGVSKATIPTMAGMVAALSGIIGDTYLSRRAAAEQELLEDHLTTDH
ncbi:MAG: TonB2 energy transduction system inner membrane component ExbB [Gammaproteobacteria bacterium]|nr:MAG: TonB2 energy transduction system inner membrane component ExbB [Gammaproteobacteria bacterium]